MLRSASSSDDLVVAVVDSSSDDKCLGQPCRNLILAISHHRPGKCRVLAFRDPHLSAQGDSCTVRSRVFSVDASKRSILDTEPLPPANTLGSWTDILPFDLSQFMDKKTIAAEAVDLNVKLIKWRLLPELEPEKMKDKKFLLVGSGTLGCSVARSLMGWGVRKITFLDNGKVSFSNPVRQSLFTHEDAAQGRSKAKAAKEAMEAIMPDAEAAYVEMNIPMPGHPHQKRDDLKKTIAQLRELIDSHDVVFMLTDSRESRWLPSFLVEVAQRKKTEPAAAPSGDFEPPSRAPKMPPLGMTVALGFDSFIVSRQSYQESKAACYFCNDLTSPKDSLAFRTLDQQCTVTRPGLSSISSGIAVELVASLAQHKDGFAAPHACESGKHSCLGAVPHQIRGFVGEFKTSPMESEPFAQCICCSKNVLDKYAQEGDEFIADVIQDSSILEEISGLAKFKSSVNTDDCFAFDDFDEDDNWGEEN